MSGKRKSSEKVAPKTILSYFSSAKCAGSPSKTSKVAPKTLKVKNQNNNNKVRKRKTIFTSPRKRSKPINSNPIVISSDESEENFSIAKSKRPRKSVVSPKKRKTRQKLDHSTSSGQSPATPNKNYARNPGRKYTVGESETQNDRPICKTETAENRIEHTNNFQLNAEEKFSTNKVLLSDDQELPEKTQSKYLKHFKKDNNSSSKKDNFGGISYKIELPSDVDGKIPKSDDMDEENLEEETEGRIAYYLLNFRQVLDTVLANDDDRVLFEGTDMSWINKFNNLPSAAQKLYVRLYHRKMSWLRLEQVKYPDISKYIHRVLKKLWHDGFLLSFDQDTTNDVGLADILNLLPAPALKELAKSYKINVNGRQKSQIIDDLQDMCKKQACVIDRFFPKKSSKGGTPRKGLEDKVTKHACRILGPCYKVAAYPRTVFNRVLLVFDVTRGIDDETECSLTGSQNAMRQGRHLQLSAILMEGMGKVSYPTCEIDRPTPIFRRRTDLLHYETAFQFQTDTLACVEAGQWDEAAALCDSANSVKIDVETNDPESLEHSKNLPEFLRCFTAQWTYTRLRSLEVEVLQRLKNYKKAAEILEELLNQRTFCRARRGHWWERLALNVDQHLKDPVRSLNVICDSQEDSDVRVGHKLALAQRISKILKSRSAKKSLQLSSTQKNKLDAITESLKIEEAPEVEIKGRLLPGEVQTGKSRFVTTERDEEDSESESKILCSVEELALAHYKKLGYDQGIHGEGGTFSALFCLFLWDIIFMPGIPDVFRTSYQTHPLDYHTDEFYLRRKDAIEKRLQLIKNLKDEDFAPPDTANDQNDNSTALDVLTMTWDLEYEKVCTGMNWERFTSLEQAKGFVKCIGGEVLSGIFRRLAKDLRHTRSGMPDLVVWNPSDNIYKMVEVKGPGDRLSTNQKLWIDELLRLGANVEVCKVKAIGGKNIRE